MSNSTIPGISNSTIPGRSSLTLVDFYLHSGWDTDQILACILTQKISSVFSIVGSIYVLQDVLRDPKKRSESIYHRIMIGVSFSDLIFCLNQFVSTWAMPMGSHKFAVGSEGTCDASGFILELAVTLTPLYTCSLATYYLLELKFNWPSSKMKSFEKWLHILPWKLALIPAIMSVATDALGPHGFSCWIGNSNNLLDCDHPDSTVACINETGYAVVFSISLVIFILSCLYIIVTMYMVFKHVCDVETKAQQYSFSKWRKESLAKSKSSNDRKRSHRVMVQGIMYSVALFLAYLPPIIGIILDENETFASEIIIQTLTPLLGLYNTFIYTGILQKYVYKKSCNCLRDKRFAKKNTILHNNTKRSNDGEQSLTITLNNTQLKTDEKECNSLEHQIENDSLILVVEEQVPSSEKDNGNMKY